MEKRRPHYDLNAVKAAIGSVETLAMTETARRSALDLGFDAGGVVSVVQGMDRTMFKKSMTTYADHRVWQDVYHVPVSSLVIYLKFQADVVTDFMLISFKEK
jgi:motility quorum-sensing regulator/GCU-specific mRNA interferase toxin